VPLNVSRTFTLTVRRGTESLSSPVTVSAIDGVASAWTLLDNFDRYAVGPVQNGGHWGDVGTATMVTNVNGNRMLDPRGTARAAILPLHDLAVKEGQQRTLFMRVYVQGNPATAILSLVGLTDRGVRSYGDASDAGGIGPTAIPSNESGDLMIGARNGVLAARDFAPPTLAVNQVYNLWIDIRNDPVAAGDTYSIYLQRQGDASRTQLFKDYICDRDPAGAPASSGGGTTLPDLDKLFVGNNAANAVFFDDFYLSKSGYNSTVPRAFGFTTPLAAQPPTLTVSRSGNQVQISFSSGILESAGSITGSWSTVTNASPPSYLVTPAGTQQFFRARQ